MKEQKTQTGEKEPMTWVMVKPKGAKAIYPIPMPMEEHDNYLKLLKMEKQEIK